MNKSIVLNLVPNKSNYIKINIISNIISIKKSNYINYINEFDKFRSLFQVLSHYTNSTHYLK